MKLYGITHDAGTGASIIRLPKTYKVGIGLPRGPDVHVFIHRGAWVIQWTPAGSSELKIERFPIEGDGAD